jgi:hypothetical protein
MTRWGNERDPVGFWTILFAVAGGVLLADLLKGLLAALLAGAALSAFSKSVEEHGTKPGHLPARPGLIEAETAQDAPPHLPGPVAARANASSWACISGFVADRSGNGWQQRSPLQPCIAE